MLSEFLDDDFVVQEEVEFDAKDLLTAEEAEMLGRKIVSYFEDFEEITDYYLDRKLEKLKGISTSLWGDYGQSDQFFNNFNMEPKDMKISVSDASNTSLLWKEGIQITSSFPIEDMPGRNIKFIVKEDTTDTVLGFLRIGSPTLNMKPRNSIFGKYLEPEFVNGKCVNGTCIVPTQPFGFNYLGGKLCALVCCSNEVRNILNAKYEGLDVRLFETTSLYGSIKGVSQYDGLKPYIRYKGDTESNFPMNLSDELHHEIKGFFDAKDPTFSDITSGSVKLKLYMKMLSHIRRALKDKGSPYYEEFLKGMEHSQSLTTKKRYYYCDYGIENIADVITENSEPRYKNGMNYEKFDLENIVEWWKKKAQSRYENLKREGKLRTELEYWTEERIKNRSIDVIR